jgi:hypothetical protein
VQYCCRLDAALSLPEERQQPLCFYFSGMGDKLLDENISSLIFPRGAFVSCQGEERPRHTTRKSAQFVRLIAPA